METYTICEYQSFSFERDKYGTEYLPKEKFKALKQFVLETNSNNDVDALDLMSVSYRKGIGEVITAKNYVGLIAMRDGTVIEILPKIAKADKDVSKKVLVDMLKTVKDISFKSINKAHLNIEKLSLLDVFISMFINEVKLLLQKGLKSDYVLVQDNEKFLKGKLLFNQHLKHNLVHKERFYVEYHLYDVNRAENRLIKTTLQYLFNHSKSAKNKKDLRILLDFFGEVTFSQNIDSDFVACSNGKDMRDYEQVLRLCKIFLKGDSFTNSQGSSLATALLFPMEKLFESYVAEKLNKTLDRESFELRTQDSKHHLFEKKFLMRPDIVVKHKNSGKYIVLDTKWKLLKPTKTNYDISQSDMYQMYAYGKKYETEKVVLLYPMNDAMDRTEIDFPSPINDNVNVHVRLIDLTDKNFADKIIDEFFAGKTDSISI